MPCHRHYPSEEKKATDGHFGMLAHPIGRPFRRLSRKTGKPERRKVLHIALLIYNLLLTLVCSKREPSARARPLLVSAQLNHEVISLHRAKRFLQARHHLLHRSGEGGHLTRGGLHFSKAALSKLGNFVTHMSL